MSLERQVRAKVRNRNIYLSGSEEIRVPWVNEKIMLADRKKEMSWFTCELRLSLRLLSSIYCYAFQ
jgi:hypothetical protein